MESSSVKRNRESKAYSTKSGFASKICRRQYLDEKTGDVYFICGPEAVRVPAHKSVLSKASDAFDGMFYGPIAEKGDVILPKTSPEAFKQFLQFVYLDEVNFNLEHILEIMDLTKKYCMPECLTICCRFWAKNLTLDDLCWAYRWAIFYEEEEFIEFCERKISTNALQIFKSPSFLRCEHIVLDRILKIESLLCDEVFVLGACLEWARHACERDGLDPKQIQNLHVYLKDSLHKIRFGSMSLNEFCEHMNSNDGLFTDVKEYEDIFRLLSGSKELKSKRFNPNPRSKCFQWNQNHALECRVNFDGSSIFSSDNPILLGGFHCEPYKDVKNVNITISKKSEKSNVSERILSKEVTLSGEKETYVDLSENGGQPIIIEPAFKYEVHFSSLPVFLNPIMRREMELENAIKITFFPRESTGEGRSVIKCFKFNSL